MNREDRLRWERADLRDKERGAAIDRWVCPNGCGKPLTEHPDDYAAFKQRWP